MTDNRDSITSFNTSGGPLTVRHGKDDKERIAAIADISDETIRSLYALWETQAGVYDHIFPSMTAGYNPRFKVGEAMNAETIVRVVSGSGRRNGIGRLSAHAYQLALSSAGRCQVAPTADRVLRGKWRHLSGRDLPHHRPGQRHPDGNTKGHHDGHKFHAPQVQLEESWTGSIRPKPLNYRHDTTTQTLSS